MKMHQILSVAFALSVLFWACKKDQVPNIITPPGQNGGTGNQNNDRSDLKFIQTAMFVIGIPENLNENDNALEALKIRLATLSELIPGKGKSLILKDTIWMFENKGENKYISLNEANSFAGSIFIGNKNTFAASKDTLLLWGWFAELVYDKYLSSNDSSQLNQIFNTVKGDQYKAVYYFNGTSLQKDKVSNPPATKSTGAYLGELLKSCYAQNNYYPFVFEELERFDPQGGNFVMKIFGEKEVVSNPNGITLPPVDFTQWISISNGVVYQAEVPLDLWYSKFLLAYSPDKLYSIPILSSRFVADSALLQVRNIVETMIKKIPSYAFDWMHEKFFRIGIVGAQENVTDLPEARAMPIWWPGTDWNARGRGYGATPSLPLMTCGEENIVYLPHSPFANRYATESIMVHEFAHNLDQGLRGDGKTGSEGKQFEEELLAAFANAGTTGLWKGTYAMENAAEYWAEGVQAWYNTCRMIVPSPKGQFTLKYRSQLLEYDPTLYQLIEKHFSDENLKGYHFDFE